MSAILLSAEAKLPTEPIRKQFGSFDGLDNRRSLWHMLERLGDGVLPEVGCARRRAFLQWCAKQVAAKWPGIRVSARVGLTREAYWCIAAMATSYDLDLDATAQRLDCWLSKLGR